VAVISRKYWKTTEYSQICSTHFIGGKESVDPTSPAYFPTLFSHIPSFQKRRAEDSQAKFSRTNETKKRRVKKRKEERQVMLKVMTVLMKRAQLLKICQLFKICQN